MTTSTDTSAIDIERSKASFVFKEALHPGVEMEMDLKRIMISTHSKFQKVGVIDTPFGKTLVTDGKTQSAQVDEHIYHESLVHPALSKAGLIGNNSDDIHPKPKKVFIGGGGELATAREVLRHKSVERVVMVDLDETVVKVCREHLPEWGGDKVATNSRLELIIGDAYEYLNNCKEKFDVVIMDISDPIEAGPGIMLYTQEFYQHVKTLLNDNGVFVTQAGTADPISVENIEAGSKEDATCFAPIKNTLSEVFDCVLPYSVNIPSFGSDWGFVMAFDSSRPEESKDEFININLKSLDDLLSNNITEIDDIESNSNGSAKKGEEVLRYYDSLSHIRMFSLPKPIRKRFSKDKRIMTRDNPVFMF